MSSDESFTVGDLSTLPVIDVEISGVFNDDLDIDGITEEGENVTWTLSVTNIGQVRAQSYDTFCRDKKSFNVVTLSLVVYQPPLPTPGACESNTHY